MGPDYSYSYCNQRNFIIYNTELQCCNRFSDFGIYFHFATVQIFGIMLGLLGLTIHLVTKSFGALLIAIYILQVVGVKDISLRIYLQWNKAGLHKTWGHR